MYMASAFWTNTIWFVILGVSILIEIGITLWKAENRKYVIALFIIVSGITFVLEVTIFCFLKAYDYYPMLVPKSRIDDGLAGNLFSQFSITATALLLAVLKPKWFWSFIAAAAYGAVEESFLILGVYRHYWYRTWMTLFGVLFIIWIAKKLYTGSFAYDSRIRRYIFISFGLYTLHMPTVFWIQILTGVIVLNTGLFPDAMNSYALVCLINLFTISAVCMYCYFSNIKFIYKSIIILTLYGAVYFAERIHLLYIKAGWFLMFSTLDIFGMMLFVFIMDRLLPKQSNTLNIHYVEIL